MTFLVRKDHKTGGYVVIRVGADYGMHAHIKSMNGCHQLIRLIEQGLEPRSEWLQQAARRILYEREYLKLKKCKEKYVNTGNRR